MKKNFNTIFYVILFFLLLINKSHSNTLKPECYQLFDKIKKDWKSKELYNSQMLHYVDFGFELATDEKNNFEVKKTKTGNYVIGAITSQNIYGDIRSGDELLSIGGTQSKNIVINSDNRYRFFEELNDVQNFVFSRNGRKFERELKKLDRLKQEESITVDIKNINKINIKDSSFNLKLGYQISNEWDVDTENLYFGKMVIDTLIFKSDEGEWMDSNCNKIPIKTMEDLRFPYPGRTIFLENTTSDNKNLIQNYLNLYVYDNRVGDDLEDDGSYASLEYASLGSYTILNKFNLKSFPFDKQTLKLKFKSENYHSENELRASIYTYKNLDNLISNNDLNGWNFIDYKIYNSIEANPINRAFYSSVIVIELNLERESSYYLYKIIFPIFLILMVCWSVVWVDPKELEARLTITIVCLLSLIAYNFVIDSELPKLEYLTVLDWIVLISYIYATIPNFISVISFRLIKKDKILLNKIESLSKKYGASSYVLLVIFIVFLNANLNGEFSSSAISWMAGR